jgi:hypothetical protein
MVEMLMQRQQAADLLGRIHPTLGMWGLLDPKVSSSVNSLATNVGGWALGRLGLQKALGTFTGPMGGLLIGAGFDALARLARRPSPRGDALSVYRSFAEGMSNIQNAHINQAAQFAANTPREMLSAARNTGNRQAGAAVAQAVAPDLLRNAQQIFQGMLDAAVQYDLNNRRMLMENIMQMRQLQQQRELSEAELKAQRDAARQQRMLALLPTIWQMTTGNKTTA